MGPEHFHLIVIQGFIYQVITSNAQYMQYAGTPYSIPTYVTGYPVQSYAPSPSPVYPQPYPQPASKYEPATTLQPFQTPPKPVGIPASYAQPGPSSPAQVPIPINAVTPSVYQPTAYQASPHQQPIKATSITPSAPESPKTQPILPTPCKTKETLPQTTPTLPLKDLLPNVSPPFDSNILNNLAIALQLLIVSNLIHNPPPEPNSAPQSLNEEIFPAIDPLPIAHIPPSFPEPLGYSKQFIPDANFLGTTNFGDAGISKSMMTGYGSPTIPTSRPMRLMSPYDAIGPNSPYIDYFQVNPEPKTPYQLTSDYKDLFSLSELFKI